MVVAQLREAEIRRYDLVGQDVGLIVGLVPQLRKSQLLQVALLRRCHFRGVLDHLEVVLRWLGQITCTHSESVFIVRRVRDRLQDPVRVDVGVAWKIGSIENSTQKEENGRKKIEVQVKFDTREAFDLLLKLKQSPKY